MKFLGFRGAIAMVAVLVAVLAGACGDDATNGGADDEPTNQTAAETAAEQASVSADAAVSFVQPQDGDTAPSPVAVEMEAENFTVEEAGEVNDNAGHFHIMIDTDCVEPGEEIPSDDSHVHFGDGSTSADLDLEPGEHTLCLQAADGLHRAYDLTDEMTIQVE